MVLPQNLNQEKDGLEGVREGKDTGRKMRKENEKVSRNREY